MTVLSEPPPEPHFHLNAFLARLRDANLVHTVEPLGAGNTVVRVSVAGERWEVEFFPEAPLEVEVFRSTGEVLGAGALDALFARFGDRA